MGQHIDRSGPQLTTTDLCLAESGSPELSTLLALTFASLPTLAATLPLPDERDPPSWRAPAPPPPAAPDRVPDSWLDVLAVRDPVPQFVPWSAGWFPADLSPASTVFSSGDDSYWAFLQDEAERAASAGWVSQVSPDVYLVQ